MENKGTILNPYTEEEFNAMMDAGTWKGGYVQGLGYCGASFEKTASSISSDASESECSISDSLIDSDFSDPSDPFDNENSDKSHKEEENDSDNGNSNQSGNGGNTSPNGGVVSGGYGYNSSNTNPFDNAGEGNSSKQYTYTKEEANRLIDNGEWKGGYVIGLGYVLPVVICVPDYLNPPASGYEVLNNALEFMGTPYKYDGWDKSGIDCSGLVSAALKIERWSTRYGDIPTTTRILLNSTDRSFINELQLGDILVWRFGDKGHCCIYVEKTKIFHAHGEDGTPTGYTSDLIIYWFSQYGIPKVYRKL